MLADVSVMQFYPSKFVLVTEILDTFGKLVYDRIWEKSTYKPSGSSKAVQLPGTMRFAIIVSMDVILICCVLICINCHKNIKKPCIYIVCVCSLAWVFVDLRVYYCFAENFTPDQVPESAKETCRNWFFKIASIRELIPRFYVEAAILKCYSFFNPRSVEVMHTQVDWSYLFEDMNRQLFLSQFIFCFLVFTTFVPISWVRIAWKKDLLCTWVNKF